GIDMKILKCPTLFSYIHHKKLLSQYMIFTIQNGISQQNTLVLLGKGRHQRLDLSFLHGLTNILGDKVEDFISQFFNKNREQDKSCYLLTTHEVLSLSKMYLAVAFLQNCQIWSREITDLTKKYLMALLVGLGMDLYFPAVVSSNSHINRKKVSALSKILEVELNMIKHMILLFATNGIGPNQSKSIYSERFYLAAHPLEFALLFALSFKKKLASFWGLLLIRKTKIEKNRETIAVAVEGVYRKYGE
ncbi:hypothetical protein ACJX0J_032745, partial [Zea mays]